METKEVSTQTAVEEATPSSEQIKALLLGMEKREVSTQTPVEVTGGSSLAIKAEISVSPMKKDGSRPETAGDDHKAAVTIAEESSDQQAKKPTAKKKGSFKRREEKDQNLPVERVAREMGDARTNYELNKAEDRDDSSDRNRKAVNIDAAVSVEECVDEKKNTEIGSETNQSVKDDDADEKNSGEINPTGDTTPEDTEETKEAKMAPQSSGMVEEENAADILERHESSTSNDETDSCSSLSSTAFNLESRLEDSTPETRSSIAEAARLPGALHTPDCKRRQFLSPDETQALIQLQNELGKFSFYICGDGRVVIHPEDMVAKTNLGLLKRRFLEITGVTRRDFKIILKESSFNGMFCTHRIGAKVVADGRQTTAGMYVSHNGVLYLISSAHNYVFSEPGYDGSETKKMLLLDEGKSFIDLEGEKLPLRPLYCVFSRMCDLKEKGRRIMHLVDISIGLAPFCTSRMERGRAQFCASIEEGQDHCGDCGETLEDCNDSRHCRDSNLCRFKIARFYDFGGPMCCPADSGEDQLRRYYDEKLLIQGGALVRCRPCDRSVVAGRVLSFDNAVTVRVDEQRSIAATNVLLITPVKRSVTPQLGDSGSVWVLDGTNDAVAITVGLGEAPDGGLLWAAAPLQPLLEAVCCAFHEVFSDVSTIKPACHGIVCPPTTPVSEAAATATPLSVPSNTASLVGLVTEGDLGYVTAPSNPES